MSDRPADRPPPWWIPPRDRRAARLIRLYLGLLCFGLSMALLVRAELGLGSWAVLHQGLSERIGLPMGVVTIAVSLLVMLVWIPLRERPGLGTVSNALLVGLVLDGTLALLDTPESLLVRWVFLLVGVGLNAVATALYIGAGLGPGPRDGLMTGLTRRGLSIRRARTLIELTVLAIGFLLGGTVGLGTLVFVLAIGPLTHVLLPRLSVPTAERGPN